MIYTEEQMISFFNERGYVINKISTEKVEMWKENIFILAAKDIETIFKKHPLSPIYK